MGAREQAQAAVTPMADHVERFWRYLKMNRVRILVELERDGYCDSSSFPDTVAKALLAEHDAALAAPSAPAQEPVAWQYRYLDENIAGDTDWHTCDRLRYEHCKQHPARYEVQGLYAAPALGGVSDPLLPGLKRAAYIVQQFWEPGCIVPAFDSINKEIEELEAAALRRALGTEEAGRG